MPEAPAALQTPSRTLPAIVSDYLAEFVAGSTLRVANYPGRQWTGKVMGAFNRTQGHAFSVLSAGGVTLDCWHRPGDASTHLKPDTPRRLPILLAHGWFEVKERYRSHALRFNRFGRDVVLFDHRAHGRSTGKVNTFGIHERQDLSHILDCAQEKGLLPEGKVLTVGFSMGASTVIQHAAMDDRVAGTVAIAPFVDFRTAVNSYRRNLAPWMGEQWLARGFERKLRSHDVELNDVSPLESLRELRKPVLLIEGSRDRALPPDVHCEPLAGGKPHGRLERMIITQARHGTITRKWWPQMDSRMEAFFRSVDAEAA